MQTASLPVDGKTDAVVDGAAAAARRSLIEVIANPLNEVHQARATRAMAQIEQAIESAQRRADAQYERAVAEAKRTGRSQDVDGVSLSDEGLAGRASMPSRTSPSRWRSTNRRIARLRLRLEPALGAARSRSPAPLTRDRVPSNVYRRKGPGERFCEAESQVYLGQVARRRCEARGFDAYEVTAGATPPGNANR